MIQANSLIKAIADPDNLRLAFWKASKGKRHTHQVLSYQADLEDNLLFLRGQILRGITEVGNYRYFKVFEPKERQICASAFSEQVLHHGLMNVCHPIFERQLLDCSYASRQGKGTYAAITEAQRRTKNYEYFLKLDVRKFFDSIEHNVLQTQLSRLFKDKTVLAIFQQIIDSYTTQPNRGLPIGNLTSQYFANQYLSPLDHYIKEQLKARAYVRYMDDMVIWHNDKEVLKDMKDKINQFTKNKLLCDLKPEILNKTEHGVPFLGYLIFRNKMKLLQGSKRRFIRKAKNVEQKYHSGEWNEAKCQAHILPLLAFTQHANTEGLRKKIFYG